MEMYFVNGIVGLWMLCASWYSFKDELNPQFLLTVSLFVLYFLNFLTSGYEGGESFGLPSYLVPGYQLTILLICVAIFTTSFLIEKLRPLSKDRIKGVVLADLVNPNHNVVVIYGAIAWLILAVEIFKRLYASDWSIIGVLLHSLGPRGFAPWGTGGQALGDGSFIYSIVTIVLPFSGLLFAYVVMQLQGTWRYANILGFVVLLLMVISTGFRTHVVAILMGLVAFYIYRPVPRIRKAVFTLCIAALAAGILSGMYLFRSGGLLEAYESQETYKLTYHQDDNYYRTLHSLHVASTSSERWDPAQFAVVIAVNPIPRAIWPEKPALLKEYWGSYKEEWVTTSFIGELVAMFGPVIGPIFAVLTAVLLFLAMRGATRALSWPGGLILYMIFILYAYMIMRSLLNIAQFVYLPAFALAVYYLTHSKQSRKRMSYASSSARSG